MLYADELYALNYMVDYSQAILDRLLNQDNIWQISTTSSREPCV